MFKLFAILLGALGLGGAAVWIGKKISGLFKQGTEAAKAALEKSDAALQSAAESAGQSMESIYTSLFGPSANRALIQYSSDLDWKAIDRSVADSQAARALREAQAANAATEAAKTRQLTGRGASTSADGKTVIPEERETTPEENAKAYAAWLKATQPQPAGG